MKINITKQSGVLRALPLILAILGSSQFLAAQDGNVITVSAQTDAAAYPLGQPVAITIEKCNPTGQPITVSHWALCSSFTLEVLDRHGGVVSTYSCTGPGIGFDVTWLPGECHSNSYSWPQISPFFDAMGQGGQQVSPGHYRIRYQWHPNPDVDTVAESSLFAVGIEPIPTLSHYGQFLLIVLIAVVGAVLARAGGLWRG